MLIASIDDPRVLIVKLWIDFIIMLTLAVLPQHKQRRIAERLWLFMFQLQTDLVFQHLKNELEDLVFFYIYPDEYKKLMIFF